MSVAAPQPDPVLPVVTDAASFAAVTGADAQALADLEQYRSYLVDWNQRMNLVGPATLDIFWSRHAWDSAQILPLAPEALTWADLGTGAGLPGIVLAILGKSRPGFHVHLVESMAKRCRFLTEVVDGLALPATVHNSRAEDLSLAVDIVTARACAPLSRLLGYSRPYLQRGAVALFLKGQDVAAELDDAAKSWDFEAEVLPSLSDVRGQIVRVRRLGRGR
ncbi:16S rRNA (guanine(527)-N(7))-methyltransferase RsmG [Phenylobacterium aquaticum]|uniref:16S rRNA (guanine(527)-N(7))-methyltransferase RsmG n=1 Tax=Phenylobacterium aquaticum TaxID=1763816 RepID=UPI001F5E17B2|nr:16S rRNA (guanine(527)-N(7))-methyltransferase RsmG [Phenylobacterium aquaticum]MCI3134519.1 16S rRNA (guanine(527)-N(7))-methyltransferase RsmG [Phenylobacterium aquaticum]